jgi:hypothetical protein
MKMMTCVAIMLVAGFATVMLVDMETEARRESLSEAFARERKLQERCVNYFAFKHSFDSTLAQLREGAISLTEACERVDRLATEFNPNFFEHLTYIENGASNDERLARNLVGHVHSVVDMFPISDSRLTDLNTELDAFLLAHGVRKR